jgi:hypothetical protein
MRSDASRPDRTSAIHAGQTARPWPFVLVTGLAEMVS